MKNSVGVSHTSVRDITKTAVVAALYVVITMLLSTVSFGVVQIRIAEMFNYLVLFNKRYIWGVSLGGVPVELRFANLDARCTGWNGVHLCVFISGDTGN